MKYNRRVLRFLTTCAIASTLVSSVSAQGALDRTAKVIRLHGFARASTGNFVWHQIKVGEILRSGTVVQTSADVDSYVDLALSDGDAAVPRMLTYRPAIISSMSMSTPFHPSSEQNVVRIWGDSALEIDKLTALQTGADLVTETELDLKRGRLTGNVKKLSAASKFEVKFPNGIGGVRGTFFDIQAIGIVKVYIGSMVVAWVNPKTQSASTQNVMGGQLYDAPSNQVSILSSDARDEFEHLSDAIVVALPLPTTMSVASDKTVVGMSPVGAAPDSVTTAK
jgi:hypothetical protein